VFKHLSDCICQVKRFRLDLELFSLNLVIVEVVLDVSTSHYEGRVHGLEQIQLLWGILLFVKEVHCQPHRDDWMLHLVAKRHYNGLLEQFRLVRWSLLTRARQALDKEHRRLVLV
jgi:hypothetical protein